MALQDLEMFDRLVLHQDRELHQAWPGASPLCPCSLQPPQVHHPGHSCSLLVSPGPSETFSWLLVLTGSDWLVVRRILISADGAQ